MNTAKSRVVTQRVFANMRVKKSHVVYLCLVVLCGCMLYHVRSAVQWPTHGGQRINTNTSALHTNTTSRLRTCTSSWLPVSQAAQKRIALSFDAAAVSCGSTCVTFGPYGRLNNFFIALTHAIHKHVLLPDEHATSVIVLDSSTRSRLNLDAILNYTALQRVCVFTAHVARTTCTHVPGSEIFHWNLRTPEHRPLYAGIKAWLLTNGLQRSIHANVERFVHTIDGPYTVLHARFLEKSCNERHRRWGLPTDICALQPSYITEALHKLGHGSNRLFVCSDGQNKDLVSRVLTATNGSLSPFSSAIEDMVFMLHACAFLGNAVSTMSMNMRDVRTVMRVGDPQTALV